MPTDPKPLQNVIWPGVLGCEYFQYTLSHGSTPGVAILKTYPQIAAPAEFGNLSWTAQDGQLLTLHDAHAFHIDADYGPGGQTWSIYIHDERWKFRNQFAGFGGIGGHYNQRDSRGELVPRWIRAPAELAIMCFEKMGVTDYKIFLPPGLTKAAGAGMQDRLFLGERFPPTGTNPEFVWDHTPPIEALQQICDTFGCRLIFLPFSRAFLIAPLGYGDPLPLAPMEARSPSLSAPEVPATIGLTGAPIRAQFRCQLIPVGEEWHGYPIPINDLSYAPKNTNSDAPKAVITYTPGELFSLKVVLAWSDAQGAHSVTFHDSNPDAVALGQRYDAIENQFRASAEATAAFDVSHAGTTLTFTAKGVIDSFSCTVSTYLSETPNPYTSAVTGRVGGERSWANCPPSEYATVQPTDRLSYGEAVNLAQGSVWKWFRVELVDPGRTNPATSKPPPPKPQIVGRVKDKVKKIPKAKPPTKPLIKDLEGNAFSVDQLL